MTGSPPPRLAIVQPWVETYGPEAADLIGAYGLVLDPWQRDVLDAWLGVAPDGRWAAMHCGLSVPRQNGKSALLEARMLFGLLGRGERILFTAHQVKTAQSLFRRFLGFFGQAPNDPAAPYPVLNRLVTEVRRTNGQEALRLANGGEVVVSARSKSAGRGLTVDLLVADEAMEFPEDALEALLPIVSATPTGDPQVILTGSPPGPSSEGAVFTKARASALEQAPRRTWHEWSAPEDADLDSPEVWAAANPAMVAGRLQADVVAAERAAFSERAFGQERLGRWQDVVSRAVIDPASWAAAADPESVAVDQLALAVDVAPDRSVASVALAGQRADGSWHVELDEQRRGTAWVVPWVVERCARNPVRAVVVDALSPASSLVDELTRARIRVTTTNARDMVNACGGFYDAVHRRDVWHIDQPPLSYALSVARRRPIGDGGWGWNRRDANADITPLVASTLALWGAQQSKQKVKRPRARTRAGGSNSRRVVMA